MMRTFLLAVLALLALLGARVAEAATPAPAVWDGLLQRYVAADATGLNRVDYGAWQANTADRAALEGYIAALAAQAPSQLPRAEAFAYWVNLYNAITIQVVLERYPVASIRDIRSAGLDPRGLLGPWRTKRVTVEGRRLSLDEIEHAILRPTFKDARVHYAVNCASIGCPNLQREAFRADRLDAQLEAAARAYVNSDRGVRLTAKGLQLSSIYRWFASDFGPDEATLRAHLARYAQGARAAALREGAEIAGYAYDWRLNDAKGVR